MRCLSRLLYAATAAAGGGQQGEQTAAMRVEIRPRAGEVVDRKQKDGGWNGWRRGTQSAELLIELFLVISINYSGEPFAERVH